MSSAGRGAGVTLGRGEQRRTPTRARRHVDLRAAPVFAARCAAAASLRKTRGKVSQPGSPLFSSHSLCGGPRRQGFARAGNAALDCSGPPQPDYPLREKVAANRAPLAPSHALPLVATVYLRTAALHSDEAGGSMQLAQAAKEKMHAPVFSLAASAGTKSEGTNPIPQPDAWLRQQAFFKTNPISQLAQNSRLGHQLPTAVLYQGLGPAISNTATGFTDPVYDSHGRPRCTGKERDAETGLDWFGERYMSASQRYQE